MCTSDIQITYEDKQIYTATEIKLLGLFINNNFSWKIHIEYIKSKLSSTCYAMQSVKQYVSINTLKMIYLLFLFPLCNDLWFISLGANPSECTKIFRLQKKIIRIMMGCRSRKLFF